MRLFWPLFFLHLPRTPITIMRIIKNVVIAPAGIREHNNIIIKNDVPLGTTTSLVITSVAVVYLLDDTEAKAVSYKK